MQDPQHYAAQQPQYVVQPQYAAQPQPMYAAQAQPMYAVQPQMQMQVHPSMHGQLQLPNTPTMQQNAQAKPLGADSDAVRSGIGLVGGTLMVLMLYVAWPSEQNIVVRAAGVNVTQMCLPSDSNPCRFTFEMEVPLEVTSSNYFEHPATLAVDVSYTGHSSFSNFGGLTSACPCPLAAGSWDGVVESRPVLSVPRPFTIPVPVHAVDTASLASQAYSNAMFKELASDCSDDEVFEIQVSGWLNYSSLLISNQQFTGSRIRLACSRQMLDAIDAAGNGETSASPWPTPTATLLVLAATAARLR